MSREQEFRGGAKAGALTSPLRHRRMIGRGGSRLAEIDGGGVEISA